MKRLITAAGMAATLAAIGAGRLYPSALVITDTADGITCETATGIVYHIGQDAEDYETGDILAAIMYDNGTPDDIRDDTVIASRYSGFWR